MEESTNRSRIARRTLHALAIIALLLMTGPLMGNTGCSTMNRPPSIEDGTELDSALRGFHKNMRWARYEQAAYLVSSEYKQTFLGRYEEYGEDFHITLLEVRDVEMREADRDKEIPVHAIVEVEQHWYKEPNMTVKKERYMERWERSQNGWRLHDRIEKEEWRAREKERKAKEEGEKDGEKTDSEEGAAKQEGSGA